MTIQKRTTEEHALAHQWGYEDVRVLILPSASCASLTGLRAETRGVISDEFLAGEVACEFVCHQSAGF